MQTLLPPYYNRLLLINLPLAS